MENLASVSVLRIRPAREADSAFLAWVILAATRSHLPTGWFDIAVQLPETGTLKFIEGLTRTKAESWWHWSRFFVAENDGFPVSALCAFRSGEGYPLSQPAMAEVTTAQGWSDEDVSAMWERAAYMFTCAMDSHDDRWAIENVAVRPAFRGRGIARQLVGHAVEKGRENGFGTAQISVMIGNMPARRAYEAAGFSLAEEKRHPDFELAAGSPGLWRFTREL